MSYMQSRLFRFLVSLLSFSQDITRDRFAYVPLLDFEAKWTDEALIEYFGIEQHEAEFIAAKIRKWE